MFETLKNNIPTAAGGAIEGQLAKIQELAKQHVGPAAKELANDESKFRASFKTIYPFLPMPVRLVVSEDKFVNFCYANKDKVLSGLVS